MSNLLDKASIVLTPTAYNNGEALCVKPSDGSGDFDFSRNSAATRVNAQGLVENVQILSSNLVQNGDFSEEGAEEVSNGSFSQEGAELVTNGSFDTDSNWSKSGQVTIGDGVAYFDSDGTFTQIAQTLSGISGKSAKVVIEVTEYNQGTLKVLFSGGAQQNLPTSVGTHTLYFSNVASNTLNIARVGGVTNIKIDNVSVKEVGQDWVLDTGWSVAEDKAVRVSTGTYTSITQGGILTAGKSYKVNYTVNDGSVGGVRVLLGGTYSGDYNGVGTHTVYGVAGTSGFNNFKLVGEPSFNGSITNISVKEVGQNWTLINGTITDKYNASMTAYQSGIRVTPFLNTGTFKVTFDLVVTSGSCKFDAGGTNNAIYTTSGTKEIMVTDTTKFEFNAFNLGWVGTLDNVSVIQITDDTNLPRINYEGFSYQDALGSELVVNGTFDTDSNWNKDANWSIANGVATSTGGGRMFQSIPFLETNVGTKVKVSFDITERTSGGVQINCYGATSQVYTDVGTHTFIGTTTNSLNLYINNAGQGNLVGSIDNVSVKEYLGQEPIPNSGCGHYLWEPQSTNVLPYSLDFSNWLLGSGASVNTNQILSPDGTQNAYTLNSSQISSRVQFNVFGLTGVYAQSIYLKYAGDDVTVRIRRNQSDDYFELIVNSNGISANIIGSGVIDYSIEDVGNDWYRVWNTQNNISYYQIYVDVTGNQGSVYAWGAQLEAQDFATSLIPTEGTTVTRNQDVCTNGGSLASINSTEGVLYAEIEALANDLSARQISLNNGTTNDRIQMYFTTSSNRVSIYYKSQSGVTEFILNHNLTDITQFNKLAFKWKQNDFALWSNGIEVATQTSGVTSIANTLTKLDFQQFNGANKFEGKTKAVAVWKEALSDSELQSLTTI